MQIIRFLFAPIAAGLVCAAGVASANPIAPRVPVTSAGDEINYGWKGVCPDEMVLGGSDVGEERNVCQRLLGE